MDSEQMVKINKVGLISVGELTSLYKSEVVDRTSELPSGDEDDWAAMTFGWALGKGLEPNNANEFAIYIRR